MRVVTSIGLALSAILATFALGSPAQATSVRTFVASTGSDSNTASNCPRTAPCRNLSAAFGVTTAGGEIVALDSAGYGTLTINKAISIVGVDGAFIAVPASGTGIIISAGASDLIVIRNLQITGAGASSTIGIQLNTGKLQLQQSALRFLTTGLVVVNSKAYVNDTDFISNGTAVSATGTGSPIGNFQITGTTIVKISGGNVIENTVAYYQNTPGAGNNNIMLRRTDTSDAGITVNHGGNGTLSSGTGTGCSGGSCTVGTYTGNTTYN